MDKQMIQDTIAKRVAKELKSGTLVNLGIGLPTYVANFLAPDMDILFHSENGFVGMGPKPEKGFELDNLVNAGGAPVTVMPGSVFFDSAMSFAIIRGGHVDCTVLGALQVDSKGNLANWTIPGKKVPGMGGAMDLVVGAKQVIVAMEHTAGGAHKIMDICTLPLTAEGQVDLIVTEMGVMTVGPKGIELIEKHPDYSVEEIQSATGAVLVISPNLKSMI